MSGDGLGSHSWWVRCGGGSWDIQRVGAGQRLGSPAVLLAPSHCPGLFSALQVEVDG